MTLKVLIAGALLTLPAASHALPSKPLTAANKKDISKAIANLLKDPESARFKWPPVRDWGLYCGWVNAKNSYGGYTGFKPFMVLGGVGDAKGADGSFGVFKAEIGGENGVVEQMCAKYGFDMSGPPAD